jgi:hypothetical protein
VQGTAWDFTFLLGKAPEKEVSDRTGCVSRGDHAPNECKQVVDIVKSGLKKIFLADFQQCFNSFCA